MCLIQSGLMTEVDTAINSPVRVTFEIDPYQIPIELWHSHTPAVGDKVQLALSEWTVLRIDHEVVEWKGKMHTLTRYVIGNEKPVSGSEL